VIVIAKAGKTKLRWITPQSPPTEANLLIIIARKESLMGAFENYALLKDLPEKQSAYHRKQMLRIRSLPVKPRIRLCAR